MDGYCLCNPKVPALPELGFRCTEAVTTALLLNSLHKRDCLESLGRQNLEAIQIYYKDL